MLVVDGLKGKNVVCHKSEAYLGLLSKGGGLRYGFSIAKP